MSRLIEAINNNEPLHIYMDDSTGDYYYFNGQEYVKLGHKDLHIGDEGDKDFQAKEEEARQKQIEKEKKEAQEKKDRGEKLSDEEELALEDEETPEEKADRLKRIKSLFDDEETQKEATGEVSRKVNRELARKKVGDKNAAKYGSEIQRFEDNLYKFIRNEVREIREASWSRPNMSYEGTGIIRKGRRNEKNPGIPKIFVYFDQSGSWGPDDIKIGEEALGVLNNYVKRKEIKIEIFYFSNHVFDNPQDARNEGGTRAGPEILEHIRSAKPDNVIIMTDDDITLKGQAFYPYTRDKNGRCVTDYDAESIPCTPVKVPGAVWYLFRGRADQDVMDYIKGRKQSKSFMI